MNMRLLSLYLASCISLAHAAEFRPHNQTLFTGSVQFPATLTEIPDLTVFWSGHKIARELDHRAKKLSFSIPEDRHQTQFALLITQKIFFETDENTVLSLRINPEQPYKFYIFTLKEIIADIPHQQPTYTWVVKECKLPFSNGRIPDSTIILCYNPAYVEEVRGGNAIQLPTIVIKSDIVSILGSELKLHDASTKMLLSSLDYDALHSSIRHITKVDYQNKTILSITA